MKLMLCAGLALAMTTIAAAADPFASFYGNTLHQTRDGKETLIFVNADKTWEMRGPDGKSMRGTYTWKDDKHFCIVVTDPKPEKPQGDDCENELTGDHKVGDTWTETENGKVTTYSITAGRS